MKLKLLIKILFLFSIFIILEPPFLPPNQVKAAEPTTSIVIGTDVFREYDKRSKTWDSIYYGKYNNTPLIWRVLDTDSDIFHTNSKEPRGILLLSEYTFSERNESYLFSASEMPAVMWTSIRYKNDERTTEPEVSSKLFYLSKTEVLHYLGTEPDALMAESLDSPIHSWWIRTFINSNFNLYYAVNYDGQIITSEYYRWNDFRYAFHLNPDAILFSTAAVGGKPNTIGSFSSTSVTNPTEWKLTIRDSSRSCYVSQKSLTSASGGTVTLNYFTNAYGSKDYLSAIIADQANRPLYYGKLKNIMTSDDILGSVDVALPDSLADGNYTLKLFSEQDNGDKYTDYASAMINIPLEINNTVPNIASVTPDNGTADIPVSGILTVTFDKAMDTKIRGSISLHTEGSTAFHPTMTGGSWTDSTTYTIHYANLAYGTTYTIDFRNFKDVTGLLISPNTNYSFTTQAMPLSPTVSNTEITMTEGTNGYISVSLGSEPHAASGASITIASPEIASVGYSNQVVAATSGSIMVAGISTGDTVASIRFHDTAQTTETILIHVTEPDMPHLPGTSASTIGSLTATSVTATQAVLSWISTPSDDIICYRLCQDGRPITYFKDTLTYNVSGLSSSTTYRFLLQECNKDVGWLDGPEISVTTSSYSNGSFQSGSSASGSGSDAVGWAAIADEIAEHKSGNITYTLSNDPVVPATLFHVLKGKDIEVVFTLGKGIDWIIRGKDITAWDEPSEGDETGPSGIDLNVTLSGDISILKLKESLAKLNPGLEISNAYQLSLAHTGAFGFSASLRLPMDKTNKGRTANLYYYHPDTGELELTAVSIIDENGTVAFDFSHASDYIITVDDGETCKKLIEQITVTPKQKTLYNKGSKNKSVMITPKYPAILQEAMDKDLYTKRITYRSSNPAVAVVTGSGKVIGIKPGKANITTTLTVNGIKKTFTTKVMVKKAVTKQKAGKKTKK